MSDIQRDREERQHVIEVLKSWDGYFIGYTSDEVQEALRYAIASIRTDLKYDLLYEETSGQADKPTTKNDLSSGLKNGSPIIDWNKCHTSEQLDSISTTKNDLGVDAVSRKALIDWLKNWTLGDASPLIDFVNSMPSVTPQEPTKNDLGVDTISRSDVLKLMQDNWHTHNGDWAMQESMDDIRALPAVTPIRPKGHWIEQIDHEENCRTLICSNCDRPALHDGDSIWKHKFCPHCGADMREVEDE